MRYKYVERYAQNPLSQHQHLQNTCEKLYIEPILAYFIAPVTPATPAKSLILRDLLERAR